jgi:hypothetical protein
MNPENLMTESKPFTHTAWMFKTEKIVRGRRIGQWINEGVARLEPNGDMNIYIHSTPVGGFSGHIYLSKIGSAPPDEEPAPQRPGEDGHGAEVSED